MLGAYTHTDLLQRRERAYETLATTMRHEIEERSAENRRRPRSDINHVYKTLKREREAAPVYIADCEHNVPITNAPGESLEIITRFWNKIWERQQVSQEAMVLEINRLQNNPYKKMQPIRLTNDQVWTAIVRGGDSAAGMDGWTGCEAKCLCYCHLEVITPFFNRVLEQGIIPSIWKQHRQTTLFKRKFTLGYFLWILSQVKTRSRHPPV